MTGIYLFEAKSIQSYLGRSGRLKNVVDVSDSLSNLIDEYESSKLCAVMREADLLKNSDLLSEGPKDGIHFFRAKGGSFYCWSDNPELLVRLRAFWLLYFQEAFPEMAFNDALVTGAGTKSEDFHNLLDNAFKKLQASGNNCAVSFPCAPAIVQSTPRTGSPAVVSEGKREYKDLCTVRMEDDTNAAKLKFSLYQKALGSDESRQDTCPVKLNSLIDDFRHFSDGNTDNDIALIHMDGNGMGQTLMVLRNVLRSKPREEYTAEFRNFSRLLDGITVASVQEALSGILEVSRGRRHIHLRPLVIGGDDVTLLIEPCYAYDFAISFAAAFYRKSREKIAAPENKVLKKALEDAGLPCSLTASGGILFNKKKHPFFNSGKIVEGLAEMAKNLTKIRPGADGCSAEEKEILSRLYIPASGNGEFVNNRLYSAVAVLRMSQAATLNAESLLRAATLSTGENIITGAGVFFANPEEFDESIRNRVLTLKDLRGIVALNDEKDKYGPALSAIIGRMRRITGHMMNNDSGEWTRELTLFRKALTADTESGDRIRHMKSVMYRVSDLMNRLIYAGGRLNCSEEDPDNYVRFFVRNAGNSGKRFTIFNDLIVAHHYINEDYNNDGSGAFRNDSEEENQE